MVTKADLAAYRHAFVTNDETLENAFLLPAMLWSVFFALAALVGLLN